MNTDISTDEDDIYLSRTEQKRSTQMFVQTGEQLLSLNSSQLSQIPINTELQDALLVAKKIKVGNALKRQMSFIGKLIRKSNHEEIQIALDTLKNKDTFHEKITQKAETWRDRLLSENKQDLSEFINLYSGCDKQKLNQILRHAIKEKKENEVLIEKKEKPKEAKYKRNLFLLIRNSIK